MNPVQSEPIGAILVTIDALTRIENKLDQAMRLIGEMKGEN